MVTPRFYWLLIEVVDIAHVELRAHPDCVVALRVAGAVLSLSGSVRHGQWSLWILFNDTCRDGRVLSEVDPKSIFEFVNLVRSNEKIVAGLAVQVLEPVCQWVTV